MKMKRDDLANLIHTSVVNAFEANNDHIVTSLDQIMPQAVELSVIATLDVLERLGLIAEIITED